MSDVLTLDIGNTRTKGGVWVGGELCDVATFDSFSASPILEWAAGYELKGCSVSSVNAGAEELLQELSDHFSRFHLLTAQSEVPFLKGDHFYPTLGSDRIAALVGAFKRAGRGRALLVIDAGTALTYDFIDASGCYQGGLISLGVEMRRQALHTFTSRLPLVDIPNSTFFPLTSGTEQCLQSGILTGIVGELEYLHGLVEERFGAFDIYLTGGDAFCLSNFYLCASFVAPNLVLEGLYEVLDWNL